MKIEPSIISSVYNSSRAPKGPQNRAQSSAPPQQTPQMQASVPINAAALQERELSNALLLMQKARVIIQQALTVSNRLSNIAASTMLTGDGDYLQVRSELADINTSLNEYGARIIDPPLRDVPSTKQERLFTIPSLREEISGLDTMAARQSVDIEQLGIISGSLSEKDQKLAKQVDQVNKRLQEIGQSYALPNQARPEIKQVASLIRSDIPSAFRAQGNINSSMALTLLR